MIPNEGERRILKARKDLGPQRLVLSKNSLTIDANLVWADVDEADFSGYTRIVPSWGSISTGVDGRAVMMASPVQWVHDGGGTANTVFDVLLIDATPGSEVILDAQVISGGPISMVGIGDQVTVTPIAHERQQE